MQPVFLFTFFSLPLTFTLVAASISHFLTGATKFSPCSSNKKMSPWLFSLALASVALFRVKLRRLVAYFLFFSLFSLSLHFHICGHDNKCKLNTLDNTDTETISAFRFRLY